MNKPEIYKKDQKYNIIYSDQDGKDNKFEFIPDEDMSKPKMIMKCKEANKNFVKLKEIKKLEEGVHKMEANQNINTLADLIKSRDGEGLDIGDNTIDMIVYFEYDEESNDSFDKCLKTIAEGTKVINVQGDYAVVDLYKYVIDHLNAFTANFNLVIDPADGEDNETIASNIVEGILPGLFSGYTNDSTYNSLNSALEGVQKKEETIKDTDFIIYRSTVEGPLYISGPTNTSFNKEEAIKYPTEQEALDALHEYIDEVVDPDAIYFKVARLNECLKIKEESFEDNKKFMAGEILGLIDNYIDSDDIPRLFEKMGITQEIYEGDKDIPDGKIQDIIEIGLEWLFDHLQEEDYKRILKNELEMTDEEMELYGVELEESKEMKTEGGRYGLTNSGEDQLFSSITNTEVYERLQGLRDYLFDYYKVVKKNPEYYQAESNPEELKVAADKIREAIEALDRAWEE